LRELLVRRKNKRVFLSYGHQDRPFVRFLASDIRATRVKLWMDELEILPGDSLIGKISEGLADSDFVVACLSQTSVQSNWVRTELEIATTRGIRQKRPIVLPLLVGAVKSEHIPMFLSHLLCVDFRQASDYDRSLAELMGRIAPAQLVRDEGELAPPLHSNVLAIDQSRARQLVTAAASGLDRWIVSYLISALKRPDPTERHWAYWALGKIGGKAADDALEKGLEDDDEFARLAAQTWKTSREGASVRPQI
jgi:hypothetical protein